MKYRRLGRTGLEVSVVSLGGAYLMGGDPERAQENTCQVVQHASDLGINYIDTAPLYGKSEELLGPALARVEQPFHLATKVGFDPEGFDFKRDTVLWSLERSLKRLGAEKLAIAQIHEVNIPGWEQIVEPGMALDGLRAAQEQGLCDYIGITGRGIPLVARLAATGEFDTVLVYHDYHPCCQKAAEEVIPAAAEQDMGIVAATVLASGLFVGGEGQKKALERIEDAEERERAIGVLERLSEVEGTLPQKAFRYALADARIATVSSGAADRAQLEEVAQAADMGPLSREVMDSLAAG
jgi:L-galactose dehydrogenase